MNIFFLLQPNVHPGIHSGPLMSGILGKIRRKFCVIGDTVNMASRTETSCPPGCIQVTEATKDLAAPFLACALDPEASASGQLASDAGGILMIGDGSRGGPVELRERGLVEVKGSPKPIRMFLVERN